VPLGDPLGLAVDVADDEHGGCAEGCHVVDNSRE
jgi:hypothetical protein